MSRPKAVPVARRASTARIPDTNPPFMSQTPGPRMRSPSSFSGRADAVPSGKTVSVWPISTVVPGAPPLCSATASVPNGPLGPSTV